MPQEPQSGTGGCWESFWSSVHLGRQKLDSDVGGADTGRVVESQESGRESGRQASQAAFFLDLLDIYVPPATFQEVSIKHSTGASPSLCQFFLGTRSQTHLPKGSNLSTFQIHRVDTQSKPSQFLHDIQAVSCPKSPLCCLLISPSA